MTAPEDAAQKCRENKQGLPGARGARGDVPGLRGGIAPTSQAPSSGPGFSAPPMPNLSALATNPEDTSSSCLHFTLAETETRGRSTTCTRTRGGGGRGRIGGKGPSPASIVGRGLGGEHGRQQARRETPDAGPKTEPLGQATITCCRGRRSAAAGGSGDPGPAVSEVAVGPPARSPGPPRPVGAVDSPEEASRA